jgi:hypothetical protein
MSQMGYSGQVKEFSAILIGIGSQCYDVTEEDLLRYWGGIWELN